MGTNGRKSRTGVREFTVVLVPVFESGQLRPLMRTRSKTKTTRKRNPLAPDGYQVTVPLLPGLVTYGRTVKEAREMAQDAIRVHLKGLRKAGEPIPDERKAQIEHVRVSASA